MNHLLNNLIGILLEAEVDSSWLDRIDHDGINGYIIVNGASGYVVKALPETVYLQWMRASSKGQFFHRNIKDKYIIDKMPTDEILQRIKNNEK